MLKGPEVDCDDLDCSQTIFSEESQKSHRNTGLVFTKIYRWFLIHSCIVLKYMLLLLVTRHVAFVKSLDTKETNHKVGYTNHRVSMH